MKQLSEQDKQLLLKDLSARLPYSVRVKYGGHVYTLGYVDRSGEVGIISTIGSRITNISEIEPYLRPMSSMTDEEWEEFMALFDDSWSIEPTIKSLKFALRSISNVNDWLNQHHFDYRGLIEKGLALEAPEGMYKLNK